MNSNDLNTEIQVVYEVLQRALDDKYYSDLCVSPASVFRQALFDISPSEEKHFNEFFHSAIPPKYHDWQAGNGPRKLEDVDGIACVLCKIAAWTVASAVVTAGLAGLTAVTKDSTLVILLSTFTKYSKEDVVKFLKELDQTTLKSIGRVADRVCIWMGACG